MHPTSDGVVPASRAYFGLVYWYAVLPFHQPVFRGMLTGIQRDAVQIAMLPQT